MQTLTVPQGELRLARYPERPRETLRAWDAADEYLLHQVAGRDLGVTVLINDGFGALAAASGARDAHLVSDSVLAHRAALANCERNAASPPTLLSSLDPLPERVDTAWIKVPKSLALLEDQLRRLRGSLTPDSVVVGAGMARHIHTSTLKLFERLIGPTRTSRARKKARLIHSTFDPGLTVAADPWPKRYALDGGAVVVNHAGVFSRERLDIGTRFLLEHLPRPVGEARVVDLGCGNGVLGMMSARANRAARVLCVDQSFMAVESARATFAANDLVGEFRVGDCLEGVEPGTVDLVLNNPPFHDNHAVGDAIAWQMFTEARAALKIGGELRVVGNRHLAYHAKLKRLFGHCATVAANRKFVVLSARR